MQLIGGCAELAPLKLILALYTDVRHHHRYHLLVNIGCCHSICHHGFSWRIGGHAKKLHQAGSRGYRRSRERRRTTPNYSLKARSPGSNRRTASTYPLSNRPRRTRLYHRATAHHDKSDKTFLSPVLIKWWSDKRGPDADRLALAQKQFDFYAT